MLRRESPETEVARDLSMTAAVRADRAASIARRLAACEPHALAERLAYQRLLALLGGRALKGTPVPFDQSFEDAVEADAAANRGRGLALETLAGHVAARLEVAGIRVLPLKGPFLAGRLYHDVGMRSTNDLDLLVDYGNLPRALEVFADLGFHIDTHELRGGGRGEPELHYVLRHRGGRLTRIELHWRVHWYETDFSAAMLARSSTGPDGLLAPTPEDELASLLLFYARDGLAGLRIAVDIAGWWDRYGDPGGAPVLERYLAEHPALRRPLIAAAYAAERVVGVPANRLLPQSGRTADGRAVIAIRLADWAGEGEVDQLRANMHLVDGLLSPPGGLRAFLERRVVLSSEEIQQIYELPDGARLRSAAWRVLHVPKSLLRYALGLWSASRLSWGSVRAR